MAGSDPRFDPAKFRSAIKFAMEMAFPEDQTKRIQWQWEPIRTYSVGQADSGGNPFDWSTKKLTSETDITPIVVDCTVKFEMEGGKDRVGGTDLGIMNVGNGIVTMLDVDHDAILAHGGGRFPDFAFMDGTRYNVQITAPPYGLFDVTIWDVYIQAPDVGTSEGTATGTSAGG